MPIGLRMSQPRNSQLDSIGWYSKGVCGRCQCECLKVDENVRASVDPMKKNKKCSRELQSLIIYM